MGMSYSFKWREQILKDKTLSSTTKHVAMMLHYHMDNKTGECFPSEKLIAEEASLSPRSVATHIKNLNDLQYISIEKKRGGQGWNRNCYKGLLRHEIDTEGNVSDSKGNANEDIKVVQEMHTNSTHNSNKNSSNNSHKNFEYLNEFWNKYPEEPKPDYDLFRAYWIKNNCEDYGELIVSGLNQWINNNWFKYQIPSPMEFLKYDKWHESKWPKNNIIPF